MQVKFLGRFSGRRQEGGVWTQGSASKTLLPAAERALGECAQISVIDGRHAIDPLRDPLRELLPQRQVGTRLIDESPQAEASP